MPPKGVSKTVSKRCPECMKQIPVATRHCQCGHQFFEERRRSTASNTSEQEEPEDSSLQDLKDMKAIRSGLIIDGAAHHFGSNISPVVEGKRRSERVKREKPNFYDALEYDNQMRKARKERQKEEQLHSVTRIKRERKIVKHSSEPEEDDDDDDDEPIKERKRKKKKNGNGDKKEEEIDEDIMAGITPEKEWQYSVVLADINMKMGLNNPSCFSCELPS